MGLELRALQPLLSAVSTYGDPVTVSVLIRTLFAQLVIIGVGTYVMAVYLVPWLAKYQGVHKITEGELTTIRNNPVLRLVFGKAKRWYDHIWYSFGMTGLKIIAIFLLGLTLFILLTDVGWLDAWNQWAYVAFSDSANHQTVYGGVDMVLLMARAAGKPNGAHLLSYIPLPMLGMYVAYKYRKIAPGNNYCGDVFQGILVVGFGVAVHELIWLVGYYAKYAADMSLATLPNLMEDIGFAGMCILLFFAFKKYRFRAISLKAFAWPVIIYSVFISVWYAGFDMKVSTVNNWEIGQGMFMTTQYWADPLTNFLEIISWILIAASFFVVIKRN